MLAAGGVAIIEFMIERLHAGLSFTILAFAMAAVLPMLLIERSRGKTYRNARERNTTDINTSALER